MRRSTQTSILIVATLVAGVLWTVRADNDDNALRRKPAHAARCTLTRDASLQSHYLLLSLCRHEERRTQETRGKRSPPTPTNTALLNPTF